MNDMERRKFEDSFQDAFKDAEVTPSENVWTNIELDLEKAEGGKMKRRVLFYKMLAAASIVFAMCIAGIGYYALSDQATSANIAQQKNVETQSPEQAQLNENTPSSNKDDGDKVLQENAARPENSKTQITEQDLAKQDPESSNVNKGDKAQGANSENQLNEQPLANKELKSQLKNNNLKNRNNEGAEVISKQNESAIKNTDQSIADNKTPSENSTTNPTAITQKSPSNSISLSDNTKQTPTVTSSQDELIAIEKDKGGSRPSFENVVEAPRQLPAFYQPKEPELQLPVSKADPGVLLLARISAEEKEYEIQDKKREKSKSEKLWTSVGFAAGGFNSLNPSITPTPSNSIAGLNTSAAASKQSEASGVAYSVGFSIGAKISNRWVLQGGVNYLTQSSDYTANNVIAENNFQTLKAESINAYNSDQAQLADASNKVAQTFPYSVNNSVQFVSVPVQAGYLVINKKLGFQVNAGISTDLFLQNTLTPEVGGIDKTTQGRGDDSPYRSLNFSGLMGTEVSYKLGQRYRVSLNPGLRYPFNSVYKSNTGVQATPLTFDVGLRFRYIFH